MYFVLLLFFVKNGIIPSELGLLSKMDFLGLADNKFQGQLPSQIFVPTLKVRSLTKDLLVVFLEG